MTAVLSVLAAALTGALLCGHRSSASQRLRDVIPRTPQARTAAGPGATPASRASGPIARLLVLGAGGGALAVLVGGAFGLVVGGAAGGTGWWLLSRTDTRPERERAVRIVAELPATLDLLASCLSGGATLEEAVRVVANASDPVVGEPLAAVAAALAVGTPPALAWARLDSPAEVAAAARAIARACAGGTVIAEQLHRLAGEQRKVARARAEQLTHRAGVLVVVPLGLCFLPAFVLLGIVPVVAGLVGDALSGFGMG